MFLLHLPLQIVLETALTPIIGTLIYVFTIAKKADMVVSSGNSI